VSADLVAQALTAVGGIWYDRISTPLVTLWLFLGQVLGADPSCGPRSPGSTPTGPPGGSGRARPGPGPTAAPGSGCPSGSSRTWPVRRGGPWTPGRTRGGSGRGGGGTATTGGPPPPPAPPPTPPRTPHPPPRA